MKAAEPTAGASSSSGKGKARARQPPPIGPKLVATHYAYTHPGGSKPVDAMNQDTYFHFALDEHNQVFGVMDGHGSDNGVLVAQVARDVIKEHLETHFDRLRTEPETVFDEAFELAHDEVREAVLDTDENLGVLDGVVVEEWEDENGEVRLDAIDGGTTVTVFALVDGATLLQAQVGDSSALIGGTLRPGRGGTSFREAMREHSATNADEYARMRATGPRGKLVRFVYDVPELVDEGNAPTIFRKKGQGFETDPLMLQLSVDYDTPPKNVRGDLPTILLTPKTDEAFPNLELPLTLAMTRAVGDFYMHTFGVTWEPEIKSWDLGRLLSSGFPLDDEAGAGGAGFSGGRTTGEPLEHLTLVLCSDGIWDLYEDQDVFDAITCPPDALGQTTATARSFFDASVKRGAEIFGSSADNMTGIVVYLNPAGTKGRSGMAGRKPVAPPGALAPASAPVPATAARPPPPQPLNLLDEEDDLGA